jgi:hypothetical protein
MKNLSNLLMAGVTVLFCTFASAQPKETASGAPATMTIDQIKAQYSSDVMKLSGVTSFGVSVDGKATVLLIGVRDEAARNHVHDLVRDSIKGFSVKIEVTGEIKPQKK